jgi:hypothetical protein
METIAMYRGNIFVNRRSLMPRGDTTMMTIPKIANKGAVRRRRWSGGR